MGESQGEPILAVENLTVEIPIPSGSLHAVRGVSFKVHQGETLSIVGESGCGKTITSLAVLRLLPRRARMWADGIDFEGESLIALSDDEFSRYRGARMSMIFQDPMTSLNPVYTIGDQLVEVFLRHRMGNGKEARERAAYLLNRVGIKSPIERLKQYPHELSGGLRQRMMIAMALMCEPSLIIADEPTTALDVTVQALTLSLLKGLQEEFGVALILITHDLGVVARMADQVAVMYAGKIVEQGTGEQVFTAPTHPYTQGLIDCIPFPGKTARGAPLGSIPGIVPSLVGDIDGCMFRNRCNFADERCTQGDIDAKISATGHKYYCVWEPGQLQGQGGLT